MSDNERHRRLILQYFGGGARIRILRHTPAFGAPVFVVDFDRGPRHYRTLGSFGPVFTAAFGDEAQVTEQSSMDLMHPAHLVFHYERLMSLAFAMTAKPSTALLLGVGGAAMWRFVRGFVPECHPTLVDSDEGVVAIARRWFYLSQPVVISTAAEYLASGEHQYDVILVDLYNSRGPAPFDELFWQRCLDALAPGGCLATNWADFASNRDVRGMADTQSGVATGRGLECFYVTRRGFRDNLIQYVPKAAEHGPETILAALENFSRARRIPDRGRGILEHCVITRGFPINP